MADTAKRLFGPALLTNSAATKYTVPASTTAILRHIRISNTSGTAATVVISIGADAAGTRIFSSENVPANQSIYWSGFLVMAAAEVLQAYSGTNNVLTLTVSGVEVA
jgi:hypothetical protein